MSQNFIYFHVGDFVPQKRFTAFPCEHTRIFVSGLDKNNAYLEDAHGLRLYQDEEVFLCTENTDFKVYSNENNAFLGTLSISWDTHCSIQTEPYLEAPSATLKQTTTTSKITAKPATKVTSKSTFKETNTLTSITTLPERSSKAGTSTTDTLGEKTNTSLSTSFLNTSHEEVIHNELGVLSNPKNHEDNGLIYALLVITTCFILIWFFTKGGESK